MAKGDNMNTSNKMEDYESLAKLIANGEQVPQGLLPLLLEVYQSSADVQKEDNRKVVPKEYELIYADKSRKEEILSSTKAAPLQKVRTFSNGNKFDDDWENKLILGDNLKVLKSLTEDPNIRGKVKMIYIDPPFATKQDFMKKEEKAYSDKVVGSAFIEFLRKRLILLRELLSEDGVIFVHLDEKKGHYIKIVLDEIFGEYNYRNGIIWRKTNSPKAQTVGFGNQHDIIFLYTKSDQSKFTKAYKPFDEKSIKPYSYEDEKGKFRLIELEAQGVQKSARRKQFPFKGRNAMWLYKIDTLEEWERDNLIYTSAGGRFSKKQYLDDMEGVLVSDLWVDEGVSPLQGSNPENTSYPTQKPEALLSRIINASTVEGDLILDAFAGSGTTLSVAEKTSRKWIGIDCGKLAIYTIQSRMLGLNAEIGNKGKSLKHKPFAVFNAGLYDYKAIEALDAFAYRDFMLQLFQVRDKKHQINGVEVDGTIKTRSVLLWKHKDEKNLTISEGYLQSLHDALGGKGGSIFYLIAPNSAFSFPEDRKTIGETDYRFLRIPQSIIDELIATNGASLVQPRSAGNINDTVEALAFDFIKTPSVKRTLKLVKPKEEHLLNQGSKFGLIKISKFESKGLGKPSTEGDVSELDYLAMVMIDKDFEGKIFNLCEVVFAEKIENGEVYFDFEGVGSEIMAIYVDVYGNEFREVINASEFKESK
jgi:DNA modification methylase